MIDRKYDKVLTVSITWKGKKYLYPVWQVMENLLEIQTKDGTISKFKLNDAQEQLYEEICECKMTGRPIRIDILKARQLGFSTFIAGLLFVLTIFVPNRHAGIVADIAEHARNLFAKYKFFYKRLPEEIVKYLPQQSSNAQEMIIDYGNGVTSSIRIMVQGTNAGRSGTFDYLHLSETAFWDSLNDTLVSLLQTVPITNPNSMVFFETTANGYNEYKDRWDKDYAKQTDYKALFFPWYDDKNYRLDAKLYGYTLSREELLLQRKLNLTDDQMAWYHAKLLEMGDISSLRQEYPSTPVEAFQSTGDSVFDTELIAKRKEEIVNNKNIVVKRGTFACIPKFNRDGTKIQLENDKEWVSDEKGMIKIYEKPISGHPYVINFDPAMGGQDYYACHVMDNYTTKQVATIHKQKLADDSFAYQLVCLGRMYNNALIGGETNTSTGTLILQVCDKCGYRKIYREDNFETLTTRYQDSFGYKIKTTNRDALISMFKQTFKNNYKMINDYETICEMENFQIIRSGTKSQPKEKAVAVAGAHDDLVMAMVGFFLTRNKQSFIPCENSATIEERGLPPQLQPTKPTKVKTKGWGQWI